MTAIEVRGLRKTYGSTVAVDGIDLEVGEGEVLGILGPNGAGKSTTVECVAGLRRPDAGTVRVLGVDPFRDRTSTVRAVGMQLQQGALQAKVTVAEALRTYAALHDDPADLDELVDRLLLRDRLDVRYERLSGGQQQRLSIALALVGRPRVAVLDELSTGLDPQARRRVWDLVRDVNAAGTTVLLVTHLMEEAEALCDRVALVDRGRVVALDAPARLASGDLGATTMRFVPSEPVPVADLVSLEGVREARPAGDGLHVTTTEEGVSRVLTLLASRGVTARRLRVSESTLDDAYVRLTSDLSEETTS